MSTQTTLYDLPSAGSKPTCWSLNPWKARASLNYKGLPYKTEWVEYPDLASTFQSLGVPANDPSLNPTQYSAPMAHLPDGSYVMDSLAIAEKLDELQPQPSLHTAHAKAEIDRTLDAVLGAHGVLAPFYVWRVSEKLLNPRSAEYFESTRAKRFGLPLKELATSEKGGEKAWENARPKFEALGKILREKNGDFVLGQEVSFADFVVGGYWDFLRKLDEGGDLFGRVMKMDEKFAEHWKAVQGWFDRDD